MENQEELERNQEIGLRIKEIRKIKNVSQEEFSRQIGISRPLLANIEMGKRSLKPFVIRNIARFYNINPDYIKWGELPMTKQHGVHALDELQLTYGLSDEDMEVIRTYIAIGPKGREALRMFMEAATAKEEYRELEEPHQV